MGFEPGTFCIVRGGGRVWKVGGQKFPPLPSLPRSGKFFFDILFEILDARTWVLEHFGAQKCLLGKASFVIDKSTFQRFSTPSPPLPLEVAPPLTSLPLPSLPLPFYLKSNTIMRTFFTFKTQIVTEIMHITKKTNDKKSSLPCNYSVPSYISKLIVNTTCSLMQMQYKVTD
jgi:hypothetical protein